MHVATQDRALIPAARAEWAASLHTADVGPGVAQRGPLAVDVAATRAALQAHLDVWDDVVAAEVERARGLGVTGVYGDVPPIAFAVADALGVPSLAVANFSWSWIYEHYAAQDRFFAGACARLRRAEGLASAMALLPGGGGMESFGAPALTAVTRRAPTCSRDAARERVPRPRSGGRPLVVVSFGGFGDALDLSAHVAEHSDWDFLAFAGPADHGVANLTVLPHDHGLPHQDLVYGADVVLAKPGYGTVSECMNGPTPLAYVVPDGSFREHPVLVQVVERWLPCCPLSVDDLVAGRWEPALQAALVAAPAEPPPHNGVPAVVGLARKTLIDSGRAAREKNNRR